MADLLETPLASLHRELGGRMVPFAGYAMPVQYPLGIMGEHLHCRSAAALFDVSHMGQAELVGEGAAAALEMLTPADVQGLKPGRQRYGLLLNEAGGIVDDFMVANLGDRLFLVVNASRKGVDFPLIESVLPAGVALRPLPDRALLALQGPLVATLVPTAMSFLGIGAMEIANIPVIASRSGYTGEDGLEISVAAEDAERLARHLLSLDGVQPAGLGARDSLRLEAGLCLYGNDLDETTNPVEAALTWSIGKRRKMAWDFTGAEAVRAALDSGPARIRVGIRPEGRQPARGGTPVMGGGTVTSGGFGPSVNGPVAMGYVPRAQAADGTALTLEVRGKPLPAHVAPLPLTPHRYAR